MLSNRRLGVTMVMSVVLSALVLATVVLWTLVLQPPAKARFEVGAYAAAPCPAGGGAPVCYTFPVTNSGGSSATMRCVVDSAPGTKAQFLSDLPTYVSPSVAPRSRLTLWVKVDTADGDTVAPPRVSCSST